MVALAHPDDDQPVFRDGDAFSLAQRGVPAPVGPARAQFGIAAVLHHPDEEDFESASESED